MLEWVVSQCPGRGACQEVQLGCTGEGGGETEHHPSVPSCQVDQIQHGADAATHRACRIPFRQVHSEVRALFGIFAHASKQEIWVQHQS